jgi:hypothetical protein
MATDSKSMADPERPGTFMDLAFFHFTPVEWQGSPN